MEQSIIQAITVEDNITKISIMEVPDKPGIAFGLFRKLSENDIKIESIVQNVNRININDITFTVNNDDAKKLKKSLSRLLRSAVRDRSFLIPKWQGCRLSALL